MIEMVSLPRKPLNYENEGYPQELEALKDAFQMAFHNHILGKMFPALMGTHGVYQLGVIDIEKAVLLHSIGAGEGFVNGMRLLVDPTEISTFCQHSGALASACRAALSLKDDYDLGIGIAKKGMWLSFIFELMGLPTYDMLSYRDGDSRLVCPMERGFDRRLLEGKRVLLMDNDAITGASITAVAEGLADMGTEFIDLLLLFRHSFISESFHDEIKGKLLPRQHLGKTPDGEHIIDTMAPVPAAFIRRKMTVMHDFKGRPSDLKRLEVRLGVRH